MVDRNENSDETVTNWLSVTSRTKETDARIIRNKLPDWMHRTTVSLFCHQVPSRCLPASKADIVDAAIRQQKKRPLIDALTLLTPSATSAI